MHIGEHLPSHTNRHPSALVLRHQQRGDLDFRAFNARFDSGDCALKQGEHRASAGMAGPCKCIDHLYARRKTSRRIA